MSIFRRTPVIEARRGQVRDEICFKDGDETITMKVDKSASELVRDLNHAQEALKGVSQTSDPETIDNAAMALARAIFGEYQAQTLYKFCGEDAGTVIDLCGRYFKDILAGKIRKAQIKSAK